jgi:uncharacterized RDD family membrane protein YckC
MTQAVPLAHDRAAQFFESTRRRRREIVTPEGIAIPVEIADYAERVGAFLIDLVIWLLTLVVIFLSILFSIGRTGSPAIAFAIALFASILILNFYFIYFEIAWRGATPGKRLVGLRVIDRHGGQLLPTAIIARNLTREVEMFIPLGQLLISWGGSKNWGDLALALWMLFFAVLPAINRDRMRGGDLIAGTIVIALPKRAMSSDLAAGAVQFNFPEQQLKAYGAFELQVLEELLRRPDSPDSARVLNEVRDTICRKIGWSTPVPINQTARFLRDFYTVERAFLERAQLYGKARADKYAQADAKK